MERLKRYRVPLGVVGVVVLVVAFLAFRPDKLFVDDVVDEGLDDAFAATAPDGEGSTALPGTAGSTTTETPGTTLAPPTTAATSPTTTTTTGAAPSPVLRAGGRFYGIDHSAEGTASIYRQDDRWVLRFEDDTDIQNGPDLYVWLLAGEDYEGGSPEDYLDLGKIKGNVGGQNYPLPAGYDPEVHRTVLIWCLRFTEPFAAAPLVDEAEEG